MAQITWCAIPNFQLWEKVAFVMTAIREKILFGL